MKQCPRCRNVYDDELNFCLSDGATLIAFDNSEETIVRQSANFAPTVTLPVSPQTSAALQNNQRLLYSIILVLAILVAGSAVALFYERSRTTSAPQNNTQTEAVTVDSNKNKNSSITEPNVSATPATTPIVGSKKRYIVSSCGSIQDIRTGLEWYIGADRNVTWYEAQEWTSGLNNCGGSWRMPTIEEIRTLYNPSVKAGIGYYTEGRYFPAHIDPVFNAIGGGSWVWANQQVGTENAHSFNLNQGKVVEYSATNTSYSTRAFAVRSLKN